MFLLKFNAIEVYQKKKKKTSGYKTEKKKMKKKKMKKWAGTLGSFMQDLYSSFFLFFFSFFNNRPNPVPAEIYISAEIGRNCPE